MAVKKKNKKNTVPSINFKKSIKCQYFKSIADNLLKQKNTTKKICCWILIKPIKRSLNMNVKKFTCKFKIK